MPGGTLEELTGAQTALRSRWSEFRLAFERRDGAAYRMALDDFARHLRRWTQAEERSLVPALARSPDSPRHGPRELKVELVQVRELTRFLVEQVGSHSSLADVLGLIENLDRRLSAHERELFSSYFPTAFGNLSEAEWADLRENAPLD